jgi:hypothetical protein
MNHQETAKILAVLQAVWKDNTDGDGRAQVAAYQMALDDLSYEAVSEAVKVCLRELTFFPKPAEIRDRVPQSALPIGSLEAIRRAPRSAYDMGYLPRPTGPVPYELPGVPTLADILAREAQKPPEPLPVPALQLMPDRKAVGG